MCIRDSGYPSRHTLYEWYRKKIADITDYHGSLDKEYIIKQKYINKPNHPRNPDISLKLDVIKRCFSLGEGVEYVSRDIGYSRASIYSWYRKYKKFGVAGLMSSKKQIKRENIDFNIEPSEQQDISELQDQIKQLQMEVDILKEALGLLKKDQGINMMKLKNHEKVVVIDAVEDKYPLQQRLKCLCMAKSSYYYQKSVMKRPDKYAKIRVQIKMIFQKNRNCYGYRRIYEEQMCIRDRFTILNCEKSYENEILSDEFCYSGAGWGCNSLSSISLRKGYYSYRSTLCWYDIGHFEGDIWIVDKERIMQILTSETTTKNLNLCKHFQIDKIEKTVENLPDKIDVTEDGEWEYKYREAPICLLYTS